MLYIPIVYKLKIRDRINEKSGILQMKEAGFKIAKFVVSIKTFIIN